MKKFLMLLLLFIFPVLVIASEPEVNDGIIALLNVVAPFLATYAAKYEWLATLLKVMIYTRIVFKPLMSAALEVSEQMPDGGFRKFMKKMSDHWAYKLVAYLLDWFASIKLPKK